MVNYKKIISVVFMSERIDWLVFTEKPDQARNFVKALNLDGDSSDMLTGTVKVVAARGRLYDFDVPDVQNKARYGRINEKNDNKVVSAFSVSNDVSYKSDKERLDNMPVLLNSRSDGSIKYRAVDGKAGQLGDELAKDLKNAEHIIVATDWDIEGELVFNDIVTIHNLTDKLNWEKVFRIHITSMDVSDLQDALSQKVAYNTASADNIPYVQTLLSQGYARSIADYEFGYTFSFYNEVLKRELGLQLEGGLGRLKLATLNAILDQENKVSQQDTRPRYGINMVLPDTSVLSMTDVCFSEMDAETLISQKSHQVYLDIKKGVRKSLPPELFTRTSYIIHMDNLFHGLDWGRPLQGAYETYKCVSYPRTASQYINRRQFEKLRDLVLSSNVQERLAQRVAERGYDNLSFEKLSPRRKYVDDDTTIANSAHHAIIPTHLVSQLEYDGMLAHGDKRAMQAYDEVFYRAMAIFAENGIDQGELLTVTDGNDNILAKDLRQKSTELGWRKLIDGETYDDAFYDGLIGNITVSYEVVKYQPDLLEEYTHPALLSYLNQHDIGTESTREPVIADLKHSNMIYLDGEHYHVNVDLKKILQVVRQEGWSNLRFLKNWDTELSSVKTMYDAMLFIQTRRDELTELNKKVKKWYSSKE